MKRSFVNILLVAFVGLVFAGCTWQLFPIPNSEKSSPQGADEQRSESEQSLLVQDEKSGEDSYIFEATKPGQSALDLLKENAEVVYEEYDFGVFITSINGKIADSDHYWAFYLNDEYATQGADQTLLSEQDVVEWRYEAIVSQE